MIEIFLSTCPVRGTTPAELRNALKSVISIHVPREGHDPERRDRPDLREHFYPRAP